jgi:tRNA C32,U32 (ribose-2'-O)-methylase TrmJ
MQFVAGMSRAFRSPAELFAAPELQHLFQRRSSSTEGEADGSQGVPGRVLFVFGREEAGLTKEEAESCDYVCSIPIGRLQVGS